MEIWFIYAAKISNLPPFAFSYGQLFFFTFIADIAAAAQRMQRSDKLAVAPVRYYQRQRYNEFGQRYI